ncbi:MAG: response regulator transcription factor [Acutalibacteraceae bacterium]
MYNILICDDERDIVAALKIYLSTEGYNTFEAYTGLEALSVAAEQTVHCAIMDIMMPEMDGITAMIKLREKYNFPIILLTAKSQDTDKVLGLNIGADDYITKPFNPVELLARVRSQLRRYMTLGSGQTDVCRLSVGDIQLDDKSKTVTVGGSPASLTPIEFDILKLLMAHAGEVISPKEIYSQVWNDDPLGSDGTVAVHIRHLREKLERDPAQPVYLKVVWGQGYKFENL